MIGKRTSSDNCCVALLVYKMPQQYIIMQQTGILRTYLRLEGIAALDDTHAIRAVC